MTKHPKRINDTDRHVGARIRARRMMIGMSQTTLGDAVGVTFQQIQKNENGLNRISAGRLEQIAAILDVPIAFFYEGSPGEQGSAGTPTWLRDFLASRRGIALAEAFHKIKSPNLQTAIVDLVEGIAA